VSARRDDLTACPEILDIEPQILDIEQPRHSTVESDVSRETYSRLSPHMRAIASAGSGLAPASRG
jgi:hypothetical protein